ncbi:glycosyltransferase, group 2 family protein [Bacteroidales bacterium KA00344]|nr:glycosyltransferase, group 2 family protein [Bacteroidales bacterium KA00344]
MKLSVIIVSYNVKYYLEQCLLSVQRALEGLDAEVIVIDNHSKDGSVDYLSNLFPDVFFIRNTANLGFAKANNKAIRQSRGEYVLLLNPDTVVGEDVLRECVRFMDAHPKAGGAGVRMLKTDGTDAMESRRGIPTPITSFYKMVGLCSCFPKHRKFGRYYMGHLPWDTPSQIEITSGAFCMFRRKTLEEVGLLDEDFFMYGEDIDLSYRVIKGGWENWYLPQMILHYKGESTEKTNFRYVHVFYEAMFIFLSKHYGNLRVFFSLPIRLGICFKAFLALCSMVVDKAKYSLGFVNRGKNINAQYVFDVDDAHKDACRRLIKRNGMKALFIGETATKAERSNETGIIYHVFDISKYSFKEILEKISLNSVPNRQVAFYNPERQLVITGREIIHDAL